MPIREGEIYLLPPRLRHSPQRPDPESIGLVVEYQRAEGELDGFEWVCENCCNLVHRVEVQVQAIDEDLPPLFAAFHADENARTCPHCGTLHPGKLVVEDSAAERHDSDQPGLDAASGGVDE